MEGILDRSDQALEPIAQGSYRYYHFEEHIRTDGRPSLPTSGISTHNPAQGDTRHVRWAEYSTPVDNNANLQVGSHPESQSITPYS